MNKFYLIVVMGIIAIYGLGVIMGMQITQHFIYQYQDLIMRCLLTK